MSRQSHSGKTGRVVRNHRNRKPSGARRGTRGAGRRLAFESLELRQLLSVAAPTSLALVPQTGQGTPSLTSANNSAATPAEQLVFQVNGVAVGNTVNVYVDGGSTAIATGTVTSGTSVQVTSTGSSALTNGSHTFTATQTDTSSNVSPSSPIDTVYVFSGLTVTVASPRASTATAGSGFSYTYTLQTNAPSSVSDQVTYSLPSGSAPSGMSFNSTTDSVTWTPTASQEGTTLSFTLSASDTAGNTATALPVFVSVAAASGITVNAPPANIAVGSPVLIGFSDASSASGYTVAATSTSDPTGADLTGTVLPATNPVLKMVTDQGEMDFELMKNYTPNTVAQIVNLVNTGAYNPSTYTSFTGTFELIVGATTTAPITFQAGNPTATAANMQSALVAAGFSGATVTVDSSSAAPTFIFDVSFPSSETPIQYNLGSTPLPVGFSNSATASATSQTLTFTAPTPEFYRITETSAPYVDQGGISGLGNVSPIPDELNSNLRFTSSGLLAMANNGADGNSSEFFITNPNDTSNGFLDFRYTIFGKLIAGDAVRSAIDTTPVTTGSSGEDSQPLTPPKILSMSVVQATTGGGVIQLTAASGAAGPYTVTVSDGTNTQTFTIDIGTNSYDPPNPWVNPVNGTDKITVTGKSYTFTPQGESANGSPVQVNVQSLVQLQSTSSGQLLLNGEFFDSSALAYASGYSAVTPSVALSQSGSSYTLTPKSGFYGVQALEIVAFTPVATTTPATPNHGTFQLQVGSTTTAAINFDSNNLPGTAANVQSALQAAGFSGATVKVDQATDAPNFIFDVTFGSSQSAISYVAASTDSLPLQQPSGSATTGATQTLVLTDTGYASGTAPVYRSLVTVAAAPPPPVLNSISAGGKTITGSTFNNNGTAGTELAFNISGVISGLTVGVYVDGSSTPLVTGTASGSTITLTTVGSSANTISDGAHTFTIKQTAATSSAELTADWVNNSGNLAPQDAFSVPAGSVDSAASNGETITIGMQVLAQPIDKARAGALYTYTVQTNAPSGNAITVTPVTRPTGMTFDGTATFSWTPTSSQLNTSPTFEATVSDSQGRTVTIGPLSITVVLGLTPTQVPINSTSGGYVTVSFSGDNVQVYDNVGKTMLTNAAFKPNDTVELDLPAGQANIVVVDLPASGAAKPLEVYVNGAAESTSNYVAVKGTAGTDTFALAGNTVTGNGLQVIDSNIQNLKLVGMGANNDYVLNSSAVPLTIVNTSSQGTLDFSHAAAGVAVNLGLNRGQAQNMSGWNTTLAINGTINEIIGSGHSDTLVGGPAATTIIHAGAGNNTITGGSGNNIIVGGGGNDTIKGGPGRNVVIAGSGASTINVSGNSNVVIAGTTSYDANDQALMELLQQGPNYLYSYAMREAMARAARNPALKANVLSVQTSVAHDTVISSGRYNQILTGKNTVVIRR